MFASGGPTGGRCRGLLASQARCDTPAADAHGERDRWCDFYFSYPRLLVVITGIVVVFRAVVWESAACARTSSRCCAPLHPRGRFPSRKYERSSLQAATLRAVKLLSAASPARPACARAHSYYTAPEIPDMGMPRYSRTDARLQVLSVVRRVPASGLRVLQHPCSNLGTEYVVHVQYP